MAAIAGKVVENVKLSNLPSCDFALSWSQDERISVVTDQCVYVLTPTSSQRSRMGIDVDKTCIHRQKQSLVLDVGVDREAIPTLKSFPCNLDPCANVYLSNCSGFQSAVWSPLNCDKNGRCIIATLSSDFQLCIHLSPFLGVKWKEVANVSRILWKYLKHTGFKIDLDVKLPDQFVSSNDMHFSSLNTSALNSSYAVLKQRTDMLSFTCLHWFSQLYHNNSNGWSSSGVDELSSCGTEMFAMLAAGCRSGHVVFCTVAVPVLRKTTAAVDIIGFLDTKLSWPCSLAWQRTNDYQGLLAVGSTDGLVKVFSLKVTLGSSSSIISGVAQYVLWGDRDELCAQLLEWLPESSDSAPRLVVCKGPAVIVFTVSVKDGRIVQKPSHQVVRGVHGMPITGMSCSHYHTVFTCSQEGCVQKISAVDMIAKPVHFDSKRGFCYHGIAVSANGVYLLLFQTPSYSTLQSLESHQIQILFINLFAGSSIGHLLTTKGTHLQRKWDLFKALQHFMYQRNELTPELKALCSSDSLEAFSFEDLLLRQHVLSLLASVAQQEFEPASKGTEQETPHNWCAELARTTDFMCKCLVSSTLESWLKGRWDGTVNSSDSASTLVMCDWLVKHFSDTFILAMVSEVYKACNDSGGVRIVSARQHEKRTVARGSQQAIGTEARDEPMETRQSSSGDSDSADNSCLRNGSLREDSVTDGGALLDLPPREECPICGAPIPLVDLNHGSCLNGHKWQRCSVTFTVCSDLTSKCCQDCNRCVSLPRDGMSPWLRNLLERTSKCPFCWGWFNSSS